MSDQEMANRIHSILSSKAAMGMGYGEGAVEDIMELYGRGVRASGVRAGARRKRVVKKKSTKKITAAKRNPWIQFVKDYADSRGISYKEALQSKKACELYRKLGRMTVKEMPCRRRISGSKTTRRKSSSKKCPRGQKAKNVKSYYRSSGTYVRPYKKCIAGEY